MQIIKLFLVVISLASSVAAQAPNAAGELMRSGLRRAARGDLTGAIADYTRAIQLNSQLKPDRQESADSAEAVGAVAVSDEFNARAFNNRGIAYYRLGEWEKALADFDRAIRSAPRLADAYNNRGNVSQAQGRWEQALADFNRAIKLNPRHSQAYNNRANLHQASGDLAAASADYNRAIELDPANVLAWANRGLTLLELGHNQAAAADFERVAQLSCKVSSQLETLIKRAPTRQTVVR